MIGLFDSGIGGLTVVKELLRERPDASFVYLGDTARTPYGNKSPETVIRYACEDVDFLLSCGAALIVVACNTVSAVAMEGLRIRYPDTLFIEVITPAVEDALAATRGSVGVIGTRATIESDVYPKLLHAMRPDLTVRSRACPLFVPLVEEGWINHPETKRIAKRYLYPLRVQCIDTMILGCTHYPLLAQVLQHSVGRRVRLINSAASVVARILASHVVSSTPSIQRYFLTDRSPRAMQTASRWLERPVTFELANL